MTRGPGVDARVADAFGLEREGKAIKVALLISITIHILLLWFNFPVSERGGQEPRKGHIYRIRSFIPEPPRSLGEAGDGDHAIPDATPDEPEPVAAELFAAVAPGEGAGIPKPVPVSGPFVPGGDIVEPRPLTPCFDAIEYTEIARALGKQGPVILRAVIDRMGVVRDIQPVVSFGYGVDEKVLEALRSCRFEPGYSKSTGRLLDVYYTLVVHFRLLER